MVPTLNVEVLYMLYPHESNFHEIFHAFLSSQNAFTYIDMRQFETRRFIRQDRPNNIQEMEHGYE